MGILLRRPDVTEEDLAACKRLPGFYELLELRSQIEEIHATGADRGMYTGFDSIDDYFRPAKGQWTVVTGMPNHGKSEWLDQVLLNLALGYDALCMLVSLENQPIEYHAIKLLEKRLKKPFWVNDERRVTVEDLNAAATGLSQNFLFYSPGVLDINVDWILSEALKRGDPSRPNILVIDPWNEIEYSRRKDERNASETELISRQLTKIRRFAREYLFHIFVVAHPTKLQKRDDGTYPVPTPYDIAGSAHWRNKADNCICVYRHESPELTGQPDPVSVYIQKVRSRHLGQKGEARFNYDRTTGVYKPKTETLDEFRARADID